MLNYRSGDRLSYRLNKVKLEVRSRRQVSQAATIGTPEEEPLDAAALRAIANGRRRRILRLVWDRDVPAGELAAQFDVTWPAISQHLRVLRDAGLVEERREGRRRLYRADASTVGPLAPVLEQMWRDDLDRLADLAEQEQRDRVLEGGAP